jgi:hypothetical protein
MSSNLMEFLQNLENCFLNHLSIPEVIDNNDFFQSVIDLPDIPFKASLLEKLRNYEKCCIENCFSRGVLLSCTHRLCFDHSLLDICKDCMKENCQIHNRYFCRICNQKINNSDQTLLNFIKCKICSSNFIHTHFYPDSCKHECLNCLIPSLHRLKRCKICNFLYNKPNLTVNCDLCSNLLDLPNMFINSCNHIMCLSCLTHSYKSKKCLKCEIRITAHFLLKMENFQKCRCSSCQQRVKTSKSTFCEICLKDFCEKCEHFH